jgi:hypothetical protein
MAPYQEEILEMVPHDGRVSVRGPHGLGKTALLAWMVLWFATTRDAAGVDWKCLTLASVWRQLEKFLWPEIHKWARRLDWTVLGRQPFSDGELMKLSIKLPFGEAFAISSDNPALIEGAHADHLFYIFDESKVIPDPTWDSAEGAFSSGIEAYWVAASTPGAPNGRFYQIQSRVRGYTDWKVRHVTLEEAVSSGRILKEWAADRKRQWGENSAAYQNRVLGEFAEGSTDSIIPLSWVEQAIERWYSYYDESGNPRVLPSFTSTAADIGRGGDPSTLVIRREHLVEPILRDPTRDTMEIVGRLSAIVTSNLVKGPIVVDVIGLGAGVVDRLQEREFSVLAFNASERTEFRDRSGAFGFLNTRAAGWWHLRELLDPMYTPKLALPPDDEDLLIGDLTAPTWKILSTGNIQIESKDNLRERLGRSTDYGDVVVMACWVDASHAFGSSWEDLEGLGVVEDYECRWA